MIKKILLGLAAAIAILCVIIATRSSEFRVSRAHTFAAAPAALFPMVNDTHEWQTWSPFARMDPSANYRYEGPQAGEGAVLAWSGNMQVGSGKMTLVESRPGELVRWRLDFEKPMASTNEVTFTLVPEGAGTKLTWGMVGQKNFMAKAMGMFMDCEKMCGDSFEQGFKNLEERLAAPALTTAR